MVDATGSEARFTSPSAVAVDSGGNVYVAEQLIHTIRKITPSGVVTTLAGRATVFGSADGTGGVARFTGPNRLATDSAGNVYATDGNAIRKITPSGVVTTFAGLTNVLGSADGTGSAARFTSPWAIATDSSGNIYVGDAGNSTIRKITPAAVVTTLAGSPGLRGSADGTGSDARFNFPTAAATDSAGNIYVADGGDHTIRKITPAGVVTTLAGSPGLSGAADGTGSDARFNFPSGVATDISGNVYVGDYFNNAIRKITPSGDVTTLAGVAAFPNYTPGSADGTGSAARFHSPAGLAADVSGNIYVADLDNHTVRKVTLAGVVTTIAGSPPEFGSADGPGSTARFYSPMGIATDSVGNVYVADYANQTIRKVTPAGMVTTLAGSLGVYGSADGIGSAARFFNPTGVAADSDGNVYVTDGNHTIRKITPTGVVTTFAGSAGAYGSADGTGSAAQFFNPAGVATDGGGNVYVADASNNTIRKITPGGVVTTIAGSAGVSGSADGTGGGALFRFPTGVATDSGGNVYVADQSNYTIRKITPAGVVTTLAGSPGLRGSADGTGSAARFNLSYGLATDSGGNVYVADQSNCTIRKITPAGVVTTVGGLAPSNGGSLQGGGEDGTGSVARFRFPMGVAIDGAGNVYVSDRENNKIRIGRPALPDAAIIDAATGSVGVTRHLDTSPQTATSWQWRMIRQPSTSATVLSSAAIRNPAFTPDVPDYFVFRLTATDGVKTSITTVSWIQGVLTNQPPVARAQNVTVNAGSSCTASASIDNGSFDPDGGPVTLSQTPSGPYPLGTTSVLLKVTDNQGAFAQAGATVTVVDHTPPSISCPADITVNADAGQCSAIVNPGTATASDNCPGVATTATRSDGQPLSAAYPVGITTITWSASDAAGNTSFCTQTITVHDAQAPSLTIPAPITVDFESASGAAVFYSTAASDNCPGTVAVNCVPASGSTFPVGTTTVVCTASDLAGNTTTKSFPVTVLGALGVRADILAGLAALRATVTDKRAATTLDRAIADLQASLDPALWIDQTHLQPAGGDRVFQDDKNAVNQLTNLAMPSLQDFIDRIVKGDRLLATVAINDAGNPPLAVSLRASGDAAASNGQPEVAIEQYRNAWAQALKGN